MSVTKLVDISLRLLESGFKNEALLLLQGNLSQGNLSRGELDSKNPREAMVYREHPADSSEDFVDMLSMALKRHSEARSEVVVARPLLRLKKLWEPFQGQVKGKDDKYLVYWVDEARSLAKRIQRSHMWEYMPGIPGGIGRHYYISKKAAGPDDLVFVIELNPAYDRFIVSLRPLAELQESEEDEEDEEVYIWEEFLGGHESLEIGDFKKLAEKNNVSYETITFADDSKVFFFEFDDKKYIADGGIGEVTAQKAHEWINHSLDSAEDLVEVDNLEDFWEGPATLYHATDSDNIESIMESGISMENKTRGMTNRWIGSAVFTSMDPERIDSYGDTILEIDTDAMKRDGYTPRVALEPGIVEWEAQRALASMFDMEDDHNVYIDFPSDGVDTETVVVDGAIPAKYLTVMD